MTVINHKSSERKLATVATWQRCLFVKRATRAANAFSLAKRRFGRGRTTRRTVRPVARYEASSASYRIADDQQVNWLRY